MKKCLVFAGILVFSPLICAAVLEQPWLTYPQNGASLTTNLPVFFQWKNSTNVSVTSYRLVVSTDATFSGYNEKNASCSNKTTCFSDITKNTSYIFRKTNTILKNDTNYYWRVEAINSSSSSVFDVRGFSYGKPATPIDTAFTVVLPSVTGTSTDSLSVESGKPIKISAILDSVLPIGYSVKVDYGNGLLSMTSSATGADFNANLIQVGNYSYSVGIYDDKNILKSNKLAGKFNVTAAVTTGASTGKAPVLTLISNKTAISKAISNTAYAIQLSATDIDGNLKQIMLDWGDGSSDTISASDNMTRSLTHIYSTAGSFTWTAKAYDSSNLVSTPLTQIVTVNAPTTTTTTSTPTTSVTTMASRYKALDNQGAETVNAADWACTQDSKTKLVWELKTNDSYLHDKDWTYSWFDPNSETNGGYAGTENTGKCGGVVAKCNTNAFIEAVNAEKLCGSDKWRLPTKAELEGLIFCSDDKSTTLGTNVQGSICTGKPTAPTIDVTYFPNTKNDWFWTSNTVNFPFVDTTKTTTATVKPVTTATTKTANVAKPTVNATSAWNVIFYNGFSRADNKANAASVRLVHD